jgi:putative ABC transport system substrate-binding protein
MRRVGVLASGAEDDPIVQARLAAFRQGLGQLGWIEHQNLHIDYRFASASAEQGQVLAKELVALRPDAILAHTTPMAAALQRESRAIPLVFVEVSDPINSGFITSLARPGGNLTGLLLYEEGITGKWLAMLKEIAPNLARVALVAGPKTTADDYFVRNAEAAGSSLDIEIVPTPVADATDIERGIEAFARTPNGGVLVPPDSTAFLHRDLIVRLATRHRLPSVHSARWWVEAGGLMSYGSDRVDMFRQVAFFVDRILRGASAADLPVQAPTKYETLLNLKTAKALGLSVPPTLLVRADEVIE